MNRLILSITLFAVVGLTGCTNSARYLVHDSSGGVVAIPSNTNSWPSFNRMHAESLMKQHFPDGYEIVREEDVVAGQPIESSGDKAIPADRTERRIYYRSRLSPTFSELRKYPDGSTVPGATTSSAGSPRLDMLPGDQRTRPTVNFGN